jgi:hypothetical protein
MRALLVTIVAAALGVAAGWGVTTYELGRSEQVVPMRDASAAEARAVVEGGNVHDFGTMQVGDTKRHTFVVRNIGNAPLQLTAGQPSCKCTVSEFSTDPIPPGELREILLTWKPMGAEDKFRQRAPIYTNDPEHREIVLHITGRVAELFKMDPNPLTLGQFSPTETSTHNINVWGYQETPWRFTGYQCLEADTAEFFNLEARDMTAEEVAREPGAVNGQVLTLTIKAGLPLGQVRQRLSINADDSKPAELAVTGKAVGDVTIIGKDYNSNGDYVDFGSVPKGSGKKSAISLLVKGVHRKDVVFTIKRVEPASLRVKLGEPMPQGKSVAWPLSVEVRPGADPINRLGSDLGPLARIELDTGTPDVPPCVVKVRLAITAE